MQEAAKETWKLRRRKQVTLASPECPRQHEWHMWPTCYEPGQQRKRKGIKGKKTGNKQTCLLSCSLVPRSSQSIPVSSQGEDTRLKAFLQGQFVFFLGQLANLSQWCQIVLLHPRWHKYASRKICTRLQKWLAVQQAAVTLLKWTKCHLLFYKRHPGNQSPWFLRETQWQKHSEEMNFLMHAEKRKDSFTEEMVTKRWGSALHFLYRALQRRRRSYWIYI